MVPCKQFSRYYLQGWSFEPSDLSPVILSNKSSFQRFSGTSSPHPKSGTFFFAADEDLEVHFQTFRYWSRETLWKFIEVNGPSTPVCKLLNSQKMTHRVPQWPQIVDQSLVDSDDATQQSYDLPGNLRQKPKVELRQRAPGLPLFARRVMIPLYAPCHPSLTTFRNFHKELEWTIYIYVHLSTVW